MTTEYTPNFGLAMPDFRSAPWHDLLNNTTLRIDALLYTAMSNSNVEPWANSTVYTAGESALDSEGATVWVCVTPHTSSPPPVDFAGDRAANPTYWTQLLAGFAPRGEWDNNTQYFPYDLAYSSSQAVFAICTTKHISNASGSIKDDDEFWSFLLDFSDASLTTAALVSYSGVVSSIPRTNVQDAIDYVETQIVALNNVNIYQGELIGPVPTTGTPPHPVKSLQVQIDDLAKPVSGRVTVVETVNGQQATLLSGLRADIGTKNTTPPEISQDLQTQINNLRNSPATFPAGTKMLFANAAVPTGWTRDTSVNDRALRVVGTGNGGVSGGSAAFSSVFNKSVVGSHVLTVAQMPAHDHDMILQFGGAGGGSTAGQGGVFYATPPSRTSTTGGGTGHDHALELRLAYYDVIIGTKT